MRLRLIFSKKLIKNKYILPTFIQLPVFTNRLSEHDNFLRTLRQERISSEANIEQILQSSNNLEQLLLETVSDLSLLKRDFEQEADLRSSVPRLQRT